MSFLHGPSLVTDGLVLCLDAANVRSYPGSGTAWTDLSGNSNSGTLVNGAAYNSANGGSMVLDGTNDHITASSIPSGTGNFTLSCWLYLNGNLNGNFGSSKGAAIFTGSAIGTLEFIVYTSGASAGPPHGLTLNRYGGGTTGSCLVTGINMPIDRYHNVVLVRDGAASQRMFLNGELLGTGNVSNSFGAGTLHLGGSPGDAGPFTAYLNGRIANILRYNRAITDAEVLQNFNTLRGRFGI